jgi:hypothetical protein
VCVVVQKRKESEEARIDRCAEDRALCVSTALLASQSAFAGATNSCCVVDTNQNSNLAVSFFGHAVEMTEAITSPEELLNFVETSLSALESNLEALHSRKSQRLMQIYVLTRFYTLEATERLEIIGKRMDTMEASINSLSDVS